MPQSAMPSIPTITTSAAYHLDRGVFGAAAAAGKLLGLSEQQMVWALGIAGTQSSGFREMFGTHCKSFHPGRAAQNGLASALLAEKNSQLQSGDRGQARLRQCHVDQAGLYERSPKASAKASR